MIQDKHWGQHLLGQTFKVPGYDKTVHIGARVTWRVESRRKGGHKPFIADGTVVKLYATTFGGSQRKQAAKVKTAGRYLEVFPKRHHTTVAVDKLKVV